MGLLSDPEYGSAKWVKVLKKIHVPVCYLCYIGAIAWFVMLGNREFNNETYFSENALLPGLVTNEFNGEYAAKQIFNEFEKELEDKYEDSDEMPVPWLVAKMSQLHLEVYTHNFTLNYPLGGKGHMYKGTNVYGILRAPRTSSLEAIVVTAPYRGLSNHQKSTTAGIALMLAFAQFARPQKYWAKDIIFLITEHEQLGMQAWLEAYHGLQRDTGTFYTSLGGFWKPGTLDFGKMNSYLWGDHQRCLNPGKLKGRSGSIQAAINLEFHTPKIKYVEVKVEGLNGQLPNLDLVNLVHKLCVKSGIHHSYKNSYSWIRHRDKMEDWANNLWTMMGMISTQMAGVPNGNHGLFHRFNIEAVTLEGRDATDPAGMPPKVKSLSTANFHRLGVALESILRSLNNLLERFHQSYFFYMLAATNRFISIGQYMPTLCLMCIAMLVRALYLWVSIPQDEEDTNTFTDKKNDKQSDNDKNSDCEVQGDKETETILRNQNVEETENEDKGDEEDANKTTEEKNDKQADNDTSGSEVPRDEETETVLRKQNVEKTDNKDKEDKNKPTEKRDDNQTDNDKSDSEVPGDKETEAVLKKQIVEKTEKKDEEDTNKPAEKKDDKQTDNDKSDSEVSRDEETETVLKKQIVKKTENEDEEDTNKPTEKKNDKQTDNDKSDSEVPGYKETEMVLRKRNVKKTVNEDKEDTNNLTQKKNDDLCDSEAPGDKETETVLRKRNVKMENESYVPDDREKSVKTAEDQLAVTKVSGDKKLKARMSVFNIGANYSLVHLIGYAMMNTPKLFTYVGENFDLHSEQSVYYGLLISSVILAIVTPYLPRLLCKSPLSLEEMTLVNILLLVELSTVCLTVGIHNFPLGLILATLYTPLALVVSVRVKTGNKSRCGPRLVPRALCLALQPLGAASLGMAACSRLLFPEDGALAGLARGRDAAMQAVMFSVVDSLIFGNWLFNMVTSILLPIWILFWQILCNHVDLPT